MVGLRWTTFVKKYEPVENMFEKEAPFEGYMFQTDEEEFEFVKKQDAKNVWTIIDGYDNDRCYLRNGFHFINRLGYIVTKVEHDLKTDILVST